MKSVFTILLFIAVVLHCTRVFATTPPAREPQIDQAIARTIFQGSEKLVYKISWSGGVKIGVMRIEIRTVDSEPDTYDMAVTVKDYGLFHFFYPVNDSFVTRIVGKKWLPSRYEVIQREGSGYTARRVTDYDQKNGEIRYKKELPPRVPKDSEQDSLAPQPTHQVGKKQERHQAPNDRRR